VGFSTTYAERLHQFIGGVCLTPQVTAGGNLAQGQGGQCNLIVLVLKITQYVLMRIENLPFSLIR
jgi:hypothetical protein